MNDCVARTYKGAVRTGMPVKPMSHALHVTYVLVHVHVLIKADDDAQRRADRVFP